MSANIFQCKSLSVMLYLYDTNIIGQGSKMEPEKIAPICYMMKDAAMIAGDKLMEGGSRREAGELLLDELISGWMDGGYGDVAVWSDILAVPSMARRTEEGYALEDFVTGAAGYDGP
jgi:hypothetical protein